MPIHTTNYYNTFIQVAEDSKATSGEIPAAKAGAKTIAGYQYELVSRHPYKYTSDDIFFQVYAERNGLTEEELEEGRAQFFSKGQPCFRASPLPKKNGWGVHCDAEGKVAIYGVETEEYQKLLTDPAVKKVKAMRTSRQKNG